MSIMLAMLAGAPGAAGSSAITLALPVVMIVVLYFLMIRPQQKKQKQWSAMLDGLKSGDRITTTGGLRGQIVSIKDDTLTIKVAPDGVKLEVAKGSIASVTTEEAK